MKIADSQVNLSSQHSLIEQEARQETLRIQNAGVAGQTTGVVIQIRQDQVSISEQAQNLWSNQTASDNGVSQVAQADASGLSEIDKQRITLIERMLEMLTGKKVKLRVFDPSRWAQRQAPTLNIGANVRTTGGQLTAISGRGSGMSYDLQTTHAEQEKTTMQAGGVVRTADGREINFSLDVSMSRQFLAKQGLSIRAGAAMKDPLVINLSGALGDLTERKFSFDIDADGKADQISFAGPGSGFLALDRNGDGAINDGGELFGTASGNGFKDLAEFDTDGNQWIDENDAVFDKLRIWMKDETGRDQLVALGQAGVGAIYLGNVSTEFAVKDAANVQQGQVRSSGMFLRENGGAGVIQQIDLAV
ncbi:MAG: hypothetical protein GYA36_05935 [Veillonellaceae bacterium]|nr:hypothetical protein [Veillonellaceae bacterium]